ncbi:MAG: DUF6600 domain-containing protein [Rubrivivax sp.]
MNHRPHRSGLLAFIGLPLPGVRLPFAAFALAFALLAGLGTSPARAQDDPPGRVGRLAELQGSVSWWDHQSGRWEAAERNYPLTGGDRISTGADGRAELRVGSTALRIGAGTELEVLQLDDARMVFQLHSGDLALRVRTREVADEIEVVTAEVRLLPQRAGHYRIGRNDDVTLAGTWRGDLRVDDADGFVVTTGQTVELTRGGRGLQRSFVSPPADAFASWAQSEDLRDNRSVYSRHVSPEMTGAEDLDRHGRWVEHPDYGTVWEPLSVGADWAPYRYGQWAWVAPWGWTWVDTAPWGFAPFHYGRWINWRSRWAWVPGAYVVRPVYAPALVLWGGGPRVGISVRIGGPTVGWAPLAPREVYVPSYRHGPHYRDRVNAPWPGRGPGDGPGRGSGTRPGEGPREGPREGPDRPHDPRHGPSRQVPTGPTAYDNQGLPAAVTPVPRDALQRGRQGPGDARRPPEETRRPPGDTRPGRPGRSPETAPVMSPPAVVSGATPNLPQAMPAVPEAQVMPAVPSAPAMIGPQRPDRADRSPRQAPRQPQADPVGDGPRKGAGSDPVTNRPLERTQRPERNPTMRERENLR